MRSKKNNIFNLISTIFIFTFTIQESTQESCKVCQTSECFNTAKLLEDSIDFNADPCDNFYQYACGNWPKNNKPVSKLLPSSSLQIRNDNNIKELSNFLKQNNSDDEPKAVHKTRQLFQMCLDEESFYKKGVQPIKDILPSVGFDTLVPILSKNKFDYIAAMIKIYKNLGISVFFGLGVAADPHNTNINFIAISKPAQTEFSLSILSRKSYTKIKRGIPSPESIPPVRNMLEIIRTMCENQYTALCQVVRSPLNSFDLLTFLKLLQYEQNRINLITKNYPKFNSSVTFQTYTLQELQDLTDGIRNETLTSIPSLNWTKSFELLFENVSNVTLDLRNASAVKVVIYEIEFVKDMIKFIYSKSLYEHEFGMWWNVVTTLIPFTHEKLTNLRREMEDSVLGKKNSFTDISSRETECVTYVNSLLGMATSYYYASTPRYNQTKIEVRDIFENIKQSLKNLIQDAQWMDSITREKSLKKIELLQSSVVFPSIIKSTGALDKFYADLKIKDSFFETVLLQRQILVKTDLQRLNQINNRLEDRWVLTPNMVNAFYEPAKNIMTIPAGILGTPVYGNGLKALDYGAIGFILGHEITHGFDHSGRRYTEMGNVEDWWTPETINAYKIRARCFIDAFANYSLDFNGFSIKVDSMLTFDENIADSGGFREALQSYRGHVLQYGEEPLLPKFENFTSEQLFTLGFGNVWCEHPTSLSATTAPLMDHSSNGIRVNGVVMNSEEFAKIWNCPVGSNMNPNTEKCRVW